MAGSNPTDRIATQRFQTTSDEDHQQERAVLGHVLDLHPSTLTKTKLISEMTGGRPTDTTVDANERAIRDLAAAGLLHPVLPESEFVRPTRAAIRFSELQEGA